MTEKEKKIMRTFAKVVKGASEQAQNYLLGWVEGAVYNVGDTLSESYAQQARSSA